MERCPRRFVEHLDKLRRCLGVITHLLGKTFFWNISLRRFPRYFLYILRIYYYFCRMQFLFHSLINCVPHNGVDTNGRMWWQRGGSGIARKWGINVVVAAQELVTCAISHPEYIIGAPDAVFAMVYSAAIVLWSAQHETTPQGPTQKAWPPKASALVHRLISTFDNIALSPEHAPAKYAQLLHTRANPPAVAQAEEDAIDAANDSPEYPQTDAFWANFMQELTSGIFTNI